MKLPATELVHDLCTRAEQDARIIAALFPLVREHYRRGGPRFPVGAEGGGHGEGEHSDPTADAVISAMERPEEPERADFRALLASLDGLHRLQMARQTLEARIPAQAAAVAMGHNPTNGKTQWDVDADRANRRSVRTDIACLACQEPAARLISGFDRPCYDAWVRAGRPDRGEWIPQRRRALEERSGEQAEIVALHVDWDPRRNFTIGPADGVDRRAA